MDSVYVDADVSLLAGQADHKPLDFFATGLGHDQIAVAEMDWAVPPQNTPSRGHGWLSAGGSRSARPGVACPTARSRVERRATGWGRWRFSAWNCPDGRAERDGVIAIIVRECWWPRSGRRSRVTGDRPRSLRSGARWRVARTIRQARPGSRTPHRRPADAP